MSDGTTESVMDAGNSDPSMEDILASIRRIIADDADESPETGTSADVDVSTKAAVTAADSDQNDALVTGEGEIDLSEFDDILIMDDENFASEDLQIPDADTFNAVADDAPVASDDDVDTDDTPSLDAEILDIIESVDLDTSDDFVTSMETTTSEDVALAADLGELDVVTSDMTTTDVNLAAAELDRLTDDTLSEDDLLSLFDDDINLVLETDSTIDFNDLSATPDTKVEAPLDAALETPTEPDAADTIDIVDSLLTDGNATVNPDEAALEDLMASETLTDESLADGLTELLEDGDQSSDDDLDLVKSLMADLTDDNLADVEPAQDTVLDESSLVDDILDLTIDDELNLDVEEIDPLDMTLLETPDTDMTLGAEADETKSILDDLMDDDGDNGEDSFNALLAIAASAEEDASGLISDTNDIVAGSEDEIDMIMDLQDDMDILDALEMDIEEPDLDISNALLELEQSLETTSIMDAIMPSTDDDDADDADGIDFEALIEIAGETDAAAESILDVDAATYGSVEGDLDALVENDDAENDILETSDLLDMPESEIGETELSDTPATDEEPNEQPGDELAAIFEDVEDEMSETVVDHEPLIEIGDSAEAESRVSSESTGAQAIETDLKPQTTDPTQEQENSLMPQLVAKDGILDDVTETASAEAFSELNQLVEERAIFAESGPRIGDLVQEALRPMLKEWLDGNLKGIVERAVAKEVKRISSGK